MRKTITPSFLYKLIVDFDNDSVPRKNIHKSPPYQQEGEKNTELHFLLSAGNKYIFIIAIYKEDWS